MLVVALLALASASFSYGLVLAIRSELAALDPASPHGDVDTVIYSAPNASGQKRVLAILRGDESRVLVPSDQIAPIMKQAIVAVEDKRFYEHKGVDVHAILRALWADVRSQSVVEGGSTITQQYVQNAYSRNKDTLARKVREAALAWQLSQRWSKDRILTAYLNTIYFGNGAYGILQAARTYFDRSASELTLPEAALLAGLPRSPTFYDPVQHPAAARERRAYVLQLLFEQGRITKAERRKANAAPLPRPEDVRLPGTHGPAAYFVNYVTDQLVSHYGSPEQVFGGGLEVTTTIDLDLQEKARQAVEEILKDPSGPAAALVAIDPRTGAVKAMFGGTNYRRSQFNLATQAERQPGSSFKPIVLASAFRNGIAPSTEFVSKPVKIDAGDRIWSVSNYEGSYLGQIDLRQAMVASDNSVYAQLTQVVGPKKIVRTAHALGIQSKLPAYFAIGLGSVAVNPLDMTRAYATIANDGKRVDGSLLGDLPRVVASVRSRRNGKVKQNAPMDRAVLPPAQAETLTSILEDVVDQGTGRRAEIYGREVAGKTGTTDDYGDAWFVGYTPELAVAVWVGYPDALRPMRTEFHGEPVSGGTLPAEIWRAFMTRALGDAPAESFTPAPYLPAYDLRVVHRGGRWQLDNGFCPGTRVTSYFVGEEPPTTAKCYANEVTVPVVIGRSLESARATLESVPLTPDLVYVPAKPRSRPGHVVKQEPRGGYLSANDSVRLFVSLAQNGLVPNLVGSSLPDAKQRTRKLRLAVRIRYAAGSPSGTVLRQSLEPGIALEPGLPITLLVADGSRSSSQPPRSATAARQPG
ncbi:PBP1A family penicillin-binding protein [Gaiella sp.]|uniref:PBP1A family penicillin-binding protein n=1 Tax=Gaiella sp. TaxID=2663207 RepID=UPI002E37BBF2|nr:PBP1A family penicillin-binding protein [Gaiella sp.]HEX5583969.1 PBP1A family penicillin-binding protein [Gaiella sp.]